MCLLQVCSMPHLWGVLPASFKEHEAYYLTARGPLLWTSSHTSPLALSSPSTDCEQPAEIHSEAIMLSETSLSIYSAITYIPFSSNVSGCFDMLWCLPVLFIHGSDPLCAQHVETQHAIMHSAFVLYMSSVAPVLFFFSHFCVLLISLLWKTDSLPLLRCPWARHLIPEYHIGLFGLLRLKLYIAASKCVCVCGTSYKWLFCVCTKVYLQS